jgi:hypothetical protein
MANAKAAPLTDIHDIKPALAIGSDLQWLYWALAIVALAAGAAWAWRLWRKRQKPVAADMAAAPIPAETEAYQMLDALAADGSPDPKKFYFRLSAILRRYIERRFEFPAAEMTTEELLPNVDRLPLRAELAHRLKAFCRSADPIKFSGATAEQNRMAGDLAFARDFVRLTTGDPEPTQNDQARSQSSGPLERTAAKQLSLTSTHK